MDIDVFPAKDLDTVFSVLRTVLRHSGPLSPRERAFLATYARVTGYSLPKGDPVALIAAEVHLSGAHQKKLLIRLAAIAAIFNNPVCTGSAQFLKELCWYLDARDPVVAVVDAVEKGRRFKARVLAALFFGAGKADAFSSVLRAILDVHHGIRIGSAAPELEPAFISNEIRAAALETAA